jgi:hypothetical protein
VLPIPGSLHRHPHLAQAVPVSCRVTSSKAGSADPADTAAAWSARLAKSVQSGKSARPGKAAGRPGGHARVDEDRRQRTGAHNPGVPSSRVAGKATAPPRRPGPMRSPRGQTAGGPRGVSGSAVPPWLAAAGMNWREPRVTGTPAPLLSCRPPVLACRGPADPARQRPRQGRRDRTTPRMAGSVRS